MILSLIEEGGVPEVRCRRIGAPLLFERLWRESGCQTVIEELIAGRRFEFAVERAIFLTVLHRLMVSGSDRACEYWRDDYRIDGIEDLQLHHLYRAMIWLGGELPADQQAGRTLVPRVIKDIVEERLFARRRDLFTDLSVVFIVLSDQVNRFLQVFADLFGSIHILSTTPSASVAVAGAEA